MKDELILIQENLIYLMEKVERQNESRFTNS